MPVGTILVVDDEAQNLALMQQILQPLYRLSFAKTGEGALKAVQKHNPSLILLDVQLPDIDGYEVCRRLKAQPKTSHIPVIFVSSHADMQHEAEGFEAGAADYIVKPITPEIVKLRVANHLSLVRAASLERAYHDAIQMLGEAGHYNDTDTGEHIWRMAAYAKRLAQAVGLDERTCELIQLAAPMHDTGKIGIPDHILRKPAKLDADEWVVMKTHTQIGYEILSRSDAPVFQMAAEIALNHHEKWDGSGYPAGLKGKQIPLSARIIAVADVYDALTMVRPYKTAWTNEQAFEHIVSERGKHFDPELVDCFTQLRTELEQIKVDYDEGAGIDG
ncbi:HD domain-containing phosphohydrolase [Neptuniibacter sp. CAU 1671]|uniref:HD domain-containing phosphohydrolase n=1 Tax=Neptuniibacter sp. CAU 1671 TaxID=3032593 RepID=UPI0023DCB95D|nr:HD domain-containing phosphohydrolase [Neptuniibacter sp. CAU 1671]MDF2181069.1 response regulator [Neptuniibacter sp. CAU 1671]